MPIIIEKIHSDQHLADLQSLFIEYFAISGNEVNKALANRLSSLTYFHGFLLYVDSQAVAFAVCYESFATYHSKNILNIHDFMVASHHRGRGYAKLLLSAIEAHCRTLDYLKITLEVKATNHGAQKLYCACGFTDGQKDTANALHWQKHLS